MLLILCVLDSSFFATPKSKRVLMGSKVGREVHGEGKRKRKRAIRRVWRVSYPFLPCCGEDDDFTAERVLANKPDPGTPGGRLYKVHWKGFAESRDSWEPPSSFVPRYTTVWMDYLRKRNISSDVKDLLVHLVAAVAP